MYILKTYELKEDNVIYYLEVKYNEYLDDEQNVSLTIESARNPVTISLSYRSSRTLLSLAEYVRDEGTLVEYSDYDSF